ncbi:type 1 glutamine amidotransferase, partial [Candidatus Binatus sp.]
MAKIYVLQHHPVENLGTIADALEASALAWQYIRVNDGQPVPASMKNAGGLIVMGGPMGVYQTDRYPWLRDEMRLIEDAMKSDLPVLGVCLG